MSVLCLPSCLLFTHEEQPAGDISREMKIWLVAGPWAAPTQKRKSWGAQQERLRKVDKIEKGDRVMRAEYPGTLSWKMTISSMSSRGGHHEAQLGFRLRFLLSLQRASIWKSPACGPPDLDIYWEVCPLVEKHFWFNSSLWESLPSWIRSELLKWKICWPWTPQ